MLNDITYAILDLLAPRAQTKADPYLARIDDLSSAIFCSTWNQAIAATLGQYLGALLRLLRSQILADVSAGTLSVLTWQ